MPSGWTGESTEDVLQTTWLALVRHADSITDPRAVLQWLMVAARREAWRVLRGAVPAGARTRWSRTRVQAPDADLPENAGRCASADERMPVDPHRRSCPIGAGSCCG